MGLVVVVDRRVRIGPHAVPQPIFIAAAGPFSLLTWFDGYSWGHARDLDHLPPHLLARFEERGRVCSPPPPRPPLADLQISFLLRRPSGRERPHRAAPCVPGGCQRPAILVPTIEPIRLVDEDNHPIDVPVVSDPEEVAAVLGRAYQGRIYVPPARCLDPGDLVGLGARATWLAAVLPRCLA